MPQVNSIPSQKEYEKVLLDLQAKYNKTIEDMNQKKRDSDKSGHTVTTSRGARGCAGGGTACLAWVDKSASDWNNIYKPSFEGRLQSIKNEITNYQKDVQALQDAKDQAELDAAMKVQQNILQENIRETFRIETEKLREELETIPQDEPLQILNEIQHIKPEIIETPIHEKSFIDKNKNYLIIGGVGIFAVILILAVRK